MTHAKKRKLLLLFGLLMVSAWGILACGPVMYIAKVLEASAAIETAKSVKAWRLACYEYYASLRYMQKAMEEAGFSDFEVAAEMADRSLTMASKARELAQQREVQRKDPPVVCPAEPDILTKYKNEKAPAHFEMKKNIVN